MKNTALHLQELAALLALSAVLITSTSAYASGSKPTDLGRTEVVGVDPESPIHIGSASASSFVEELQSVSGSCSLMPTASVLEITCLSDQRLKKEIEDAAPALPRLADMRVRDYTLKETGERKTGVIAQEMLWKHPDMVHMSVEELYGVEAPNVWLLVKAIQELKDANDDLTARVSADDDAVKAATDSVADLRERLNALEAR